MNNVTNTQLPKLLTRKEAAAYLGLQVQTLATWACEKRYGLPVVKCGGAVRYRLSDLDKWLASRTVGAVDSKAKGQQ